MGEFSGKIYAALDKSVYLLSAVPLKEQVREGNPALVWPLQCIHVLHRQTSLVPRLSPARNVDA